MRQAQRAILEHPVAAQALFAGLVAEGRRFAATEEGADWQEALSRSDVLHQVRPVWEVISLNMLQEDPEAVLPSSFVDALVTVGSAEHLEAMLSRLAGLGR